MSDWACPCHREKMQEMVMWPNACGEFPWILRAREVHGVRRRWAEPCDIPLDRIDTINNPANVHIWCLSRSALQKRWACSCMAYPGPCMGGVMRKPYPFPSVLSSRFSFLSSLLFILFLYLSTYPKTLSSISLLLSFSLLLSSLILSSLFFPFSLLVLSFPPFSHPPTYLLPPPHLSLPQEPSQNPPIYRPHAKRFHHDT